MRRWPVAAKTLAGAALLLLVLLLAGAAAVFATLAASLPQRRGAALVGALAAPVRIEFDRHAVPRIRAESIADAFRAQGFLHAQERFFQMDLSRRASAGELAALVGKAALERDVAQRHLRLRDAARRLVAAMPARYRSWLRAYTDGVNAGLAALKSRPPEYWLLRGRPAPWKVEDSVLVMFSFYTMLSQNQIFEQPQGVMRATLPAALYRFLTPSTSRFDRLIVPAGGSASDYVPAAIPPPAVVDLRERAPRHFRRRRVDPPLIAPGSNQWAVAGGRGASGAALLANDPHLRLRVPNVFYRSELYWPGGVARGVGIPGLPGIMIGANARLAWGATVSNADQSDWVVIDVDPKDPSRYRVPGGYAAFTEHRERIAVAGRASPVTITVRSTRYGPVLTHDWRGRPLALHAAWLQPRGASFDLLDLMTAGDVAAGEQVLAHWAGPSLNWMLADADGRIGWVVNGPLPRRVGFDGSAPTSWADGHRGWQGELAPPRLVESADGTLLTANNRTLPRAEAARLGRVWMRPLRAHRIAELLQKQAHFDPRDFLRMQLDTRAEAYDRVRDVLLEVVPKSERNPLLREARREVEQWNGRADVSQAGFRVLNIYYRALLERTIAPLLAPAVDADPHFVYRWPLADEVMRRLLDARPANLLGPPFHDWPSFLRSVLLDALQRVQSDPAAAPIDTPWGDVNRLRVAHPFAAVLPLLGHWLGMPADPQPGSMVSLRVAAPSYGAVIRMAVAPARPDDGILEMFGGQSGHFLSANFDDLEQDWHTGRPTPFLAGPTVSTLHLRPD